MTVDHHRVLREAAARRSSALLEYQAALFRMNDAIRAARAAGLSVQVIAGEVGTSRQRVYEVLREG